MAKPVLRYPGAKWNLAQWIISHFPQHKTYLEPFFGSGAVFFNKKPIGVETINDLNGEVVNFFKAIRENPEKMASLINLTPWSREEYYMSIEKSGDMFEDARRFLVRTWQGRASDLSKKVGWRHEVQGKQGKNAGKVWMDLPQRIIEIAKRLRGVQIENQDALTLIERYNFPTVLIYADPPYLLSTRTQNIYPNEMSDEQHIDLLNLLNKHKGPVILSGYACALYSEYLQGWTERKTSAVAEGGNLREEVIWLNPVAAKDQNSLFA